MSKCTSSSRRQIPGDEVCCEGKSTLCRHNWKGQHCGRWVELHLQVHGHGLHLTGCPGIFLMCYLSVFPSAVSSLGVLSSLKIFVTPRQNVVGNQHLKHYVSQAVHSARPHQATKTHPDHHKLWDENLLCIALDQAIDIVIEDSPVCEYCFVQLPF